MRDKAVLTAAAERDLEQICDYLAEFDTRASADCVLDRLLAAVDSIARFPERSTSAEIVGLEQP